MRWFIYLLVETALVLFVFFFGDFCNKSSYGITRRIIEAWRTSRALGYARSVVLFSTQWIWSPKTTSFFIFRCVFFRKRIQNLNFLIPLKIFLSDSRVGLWKNNSYISFLQFLKFLWPLCSLRNIPNFFNTCFKWTTDNNNSWWKLVYLLFLLLVLEFSDLCGNWYVMELIPNFV